MHPPHIYKHFKPESTLPEVDAKLDKVSASPYTLIWLALLASYPQS